jgi:hypothetical protein
MDVSSLIMVAKFSMDSQCRICNSIGANAGIIPLLPKNNPAWYHHTINEIDNYKSNKK